jgi:hypothetical protein
MSATFAARPQVLRRAKERFERDSLGRWFEDKYKLPAHHTLYLSHSEAEHMVEQYSDVFVQREETQAMLEQVQKARGGDIDAQKARNAQRQSLIGRLNALNAALDEPSYDDDPLLSQWDKDLEEGRTPDFGKRA